MKQEQELVRALLRLVVDTPGRPPREPIIEGFTPEQVKHHIWLLGKRELVLAAYIDADMSPNTEGLLLGVSEHTHAALEALESAGFCAHVKQRAGGFSVEILKAWLLGLLS